MDFKEYRKRGKEMVDYIADYLENIRDRRVFPDVKPGYMKNLLPDSAPLEGEQWETIFSDVERVIMPGITHWQSPHMHAYFPALNSFPSLLGDMLADAINCLGFTWASSPACTELEIIVMNWLGKMINLPDDFLHLNSSSRGGGVVQTTASEATLVCLLAGRTRAIQRFHEKIPGYQDAEINARLVAYCSDQAHSSVEKAALIGLVRMRYIEADENLSMRGQILREAIEDDIRQGLVPFWVCATLGTTGSCSFDNLEEIGIVCREFNLWLHVDAAYAGSAFICPEFRTWLKGIERADSIAFNPSKWLMVHFDATALWVKDSTAVHRTFNVEPLYLQHENSGVAIDFMHWQIPLSRRFRALKMWFVLRSFGIKGLQRHIREGVRLAQKFEALVLADHRFEIPAKRHLGLVVFRIKGENEITERLLKRLNHRGNLHCIPSSLKGKYVIRFTVTSTRTTVDDILRDWMEIKNSATAILDEMNITISNRVYLKDTKEKCEGFGSSLLLSNSPLSPKIVNGSFAALFDADEFLAKTYAGIRIAHQESPSMRRRVRGIMMSGKQFSLDSHMDVVVQTCMNSHTTNTKMSDSYGKTSTSSKNEERDAICEDEESVEDCEMNWILNTALQLNSTNYIAVLNKQKLIPIDIIRRPNNLQSSAASSAFLTKYEIKKNFTKSVNSVRTPLTQCQLYQFPRQTSIGQKYQEKVTTEKLYHGKRYLNLDLTEHNDTIFTDTIFNLPTPTDEIIPIIITADTPTTNTKCIPNIEEPNKLHPPNSCMLLDRTKDKEDSQENFDCNTSVLKTIEEGNEDFNFLAKMVNSPSMDMLSDVCKDESLEDIMFDISNKKRNELLDNTSSTTLTHNKTLFTTKYYEAAAENINADFNKPLPSKSTLIPVFETNDETNYLTDIFPTIPTKLSPTPSNIAKTNQNSLGENSKSITQNHNKLFTTSSSHSSEEYKDTSKPIFSIISNQESSSDSVETKESETYSTANYLFKSSLQQQQPIYTSVISNESYTDDSQDIPQFIDTFNEDLKEMTTNLNSLFSTKPLSEDGSSYNIDTPKSSSIVEDDDHDDLVFEELNKLCNIQRPKSLTFADFSIFNKLSIASNIQSSKSWNEIEEATDFNALNKQTVKSVIKSELIQDIKNLDPKEYASSVKESCLQLSQVEKEQDLKLNELEGYDSNNQFLKESSLFAKEISMPSKFSYEEKVSDFDLVENSRKFSLPRPNSLNFADFSKFKESGNIKTSKSYNVLKDFTKQLPEQTTIEYEILTPKPLILVESSRRFKELSKDNVLETSSSIETPKSLTITENYEILKEATNEFCLETPQSYSIQEDEEVEVEENVVAGAVPGIIYLTKIVKNNKSQDDSSSSDEFLETFCQPSKDSETSSSSTSTSLDLL